MKSGFLLFVLVFLCINLNAQNGIGFQGIARDPQGNAIPNQTIKVVFTIGSFTEEQNLSTDDFGIFSATIGSVNTTDFNNLVFANLDENLKVQVEDVTIYDDKFNTVPYAKAAENGVPPGSIMPFAGPKSNIPEGWLYCDGKSYASTGMFGSLYKAIGYAWGSDGGNFRVPDLRGYFLRGASDGTTIDPDRAARTAKYSGGNTGDNVGTYQADIFGLHNHTGYTSTNGEHTHNWTYPFSSSEGGDGSVSILGDDQNAGRWNFTVSYSGAHNHSLIINSTGGNETRPENATVIFIIKY